MRFAAWSAFTEIQRQVSCILKVCNQNDFMLDELVICNYIHKTESDVDAFADMSISRSSESP